MHLHIGKMYDENRSKKEEGEKGKNKIRMAALRGGEKPQTQRTSVRGSHEFYGVCPNTDKRQVNVAHILAIAHHLCNALIGTVCLSHFSACNQQQSWLTSVSRPQFF